MSEKNKIDVIDEYVETIHTSYNNVTTIADEGIDTPFRQDVYRAALYPQYSVDRPDAAFGFGPNHIGIDIGIVVAGPALGMIDEARKYYEKRQKEKRATNRYVIEQSAKIYNICLNEALYWQSDNKNITDAKINHEKKQIEDRKNEIKLAAEKTKVYSKKEAHRQFILAALKLHKIIQSTWETEEELNQLLTDIGFCEQALAVNTLKTLIREYRNQVAKKIADDEKLKEIFTRIQNYIFSGNANIDSTGYSASRKRNIGKNPIETSRAFLAKLHNSKFPEQEVVDVTLKFNSVDGKQFLDFNFIAGAGAELKPNPYFTVPTKKPSSEKPLVANLTHETSDAKPALFENPTQKKTWIEVYDKVMDTPFVKTTLGFSDFMFEWSYSYWIIWYPMLLFTGKILTDIVDEFTWVNSLPFTIPLIVPGAYFLFKTILAIYKRTSSYKTISEEEIIKEEEDKQKQYDFGRSLYVDYYFNHEKSQLKEKLSSQGIDWQQIKKKKARQDLNSSTPMTDDEAPEEIQNLQKRHERLEKKTFAFEKQVAVVKGLLGFLDTYFQAWLVQDFLISMCHVAFNPYSLLSISIVLGVGIIYGLFCTTRNLVTLKKQQLNEQAILEEKKEIIERISLTLRRQKTLLQQLDPNSLEAARIRKTMANSKEFLEKLNPNPSKSQIFLQSLLETGSYFYTIIARAGTGSLASRSFIAPGNVISLALVTAGFFFITPQVFTACGIILGSVLAVFFICHQIKQNQLASSLSYLTNIRSHLHREAKQTDYIENVVLSQKYLTVVKNDIPKKDIVEPSKDEQKNQVSNDPNYSDSKKNTSNPSRFSHALNKLGMFNCYQKSSHDKNKLSAKYTASG